MEASAESDDAALVRRAQGGDVGAFEQLARRYDAAVLRLARGLAGREEDAWDIYQETFIKAYRSLARFRFESSFYTWIFRIATNAGLDHLRRRAARGEAAGAYEPRAGGGEGAESPLERAPERAPGANPEQLLLSSELAHRIELALRRLSPRERMVFELKHHQGLKLRTIGDLLATSEETAKNSLFRATQKLRLALQDLAVKQPAPRRPPLRAEEGA